jgi:hypothetical protein
MYEQIRIKTHALRELPPPEAAVLQIDLLEYLR